MPIQTGDIKIYESDTMDDTAQGGGQMTGNVIVDGQSNNIFEDISTLDRVYGAVKMRKVYPAVSIQTQDKYFGSHAIISKLPVDQKIGVNLFNTEDWFDRRPEAKSRVENYRARGAKYNGFLWATQYKDSKVLTIFQSETADIPTIGEVLELSGNGDIETQFVKIVDIDTSVQEFTDQQGIFHKRILSCEISQALEYDFVGSEVIRETNLNPDALVYNTVVANAGKYYSARPMSTAASVGDFGIEVDTVYSQVIPSSLQEVAILDADASGNTTPLVKSGSGTTSFVSSTTFGANSNVYLGSPIVPGSLIITVSGGTITDEGGEIKINATSVGTVNYNTGLITFSANSPDYTGSKTVTYERAVAPIKIADTAMLDVTAENRGFIWNITVDPLPARGSVQVSYIALGNWYTLYEDGDGGLAGQQSGIGTGTINYATGTISVTLASLPDADSVIIFTWGTTVNFYNESSFVPENPYLEGNVPNNQIHLNTITLDWDTTKTATVDATGNITGDATGYFFSNGEYRFIPNDLPAKGTVVNINYDYEATNRVTESFTPTKSGNTVTMTLANTNVAPNTIQINLTVTTLTHTIYDDGLGTIYLKDWNWGRNGRSIGTIDYVTGVITINPDLEFYSYNYTYKRQLIGTTIDPTTFEVIPAYASVYQSGSADLLKSYTFTNLDQIDVHYVTTPTTTAGTGNFTINSLISQFQPPNSDSNVIDEQSVTFSLNGKDYYDDSGVIYYDFNHNSNTGTVVGSIDYNTKQVTINEWEVGASTITLNSLVTSSQKEFVDRMTFRIPEAPVKSQSLQIRVETSDGTELTATSDANGVITGTNVLGYIRYETGIVSIRFGSSVTAVGNEAEWWYEVDAITNGNIWKPTLVKPHTLLYNATAQSFLPLDESILGLSPVRLPQDGRIPIYDEGDVIVVLNDQETTGTYSNAEVTNLGRVRLSKVIVKDAGGNDVDSAKYTVDLDAGTITWIDLAGVSQPITITDRIEDMAVLTDVQITGQLTLSQPLTHDFTTTNTLVSNAVIFGDKFANTSIPFDQQTWSGVWSDTLIGNDVVANFNFAQHPITVDNASCIQERWAIIFTSSTAVNVIGENVGQILSNVPIAADIAPLNPNTGQPMFTIPLDGWGSGWSAGNVLRFNTFGANAPLWIINSIGQGEATDPDYNWCIEIRGDIDTP